MVKNILTQAGVRTLSTEEMLLSYENMIYKFAHNCNNKLKSVLSNVNDFDDYVQIGRVEAINIFKNYDIKNGVMFSTYLTNALRYVYIHLVRDLNAKKRKLDAPVVHLNKELEFGDELGNIALSELQQEDCYESLNEDLEDFLRENLTEEELECVSMGFKKNINKSKGSLKESLCYASETLSKYEADLTRAELADELKISRPTLNKRIDQALVKTKELAIIYLEEF